MTRRERRLLLSAMAAGLAIAAWKLAPLMEKPGPPQGTSSCDATLWNAVYRPERLVIIEPCKTVEGTIFLVRPQKDGDLHILLDVADPSLLNDVNWTRQQGMLVLEPICQEEPTQRSAILPCRNYSGQYFYVLKGMRVRVTGAYVLDRDHGWMEIHPVTSIVPIP